MLGGTAVFTWSDGGSDRRTVTRESRSLFLFVISIAIGDELVRSGLPLLGDSVGSAGARVCRESPSWSGSIPPELDPAASAAQRRLNRGGEVRVRQVPND